MKKIIVFIMLIVYSGLSAQDIIGKVIFKVGSCKLEKGQNLNVNNKIKEGDVIITGKSSILKIELNNGSVIKIMPNSKIIVNIIKTNKENRYAFGVINGAIDSGVEKINEKGYYRVYTPTAVAGVRGTSFTVMVVNGKSSIIVKSGKVIVDNDKKQIEVTPNIKVTIEINGELEKDKEEKIDEEKDYEEFTKKTEDVKAENIEDTYSKLSEIEKKNNQRLEQLKAKDKLTEEELDEIEYLYQKTVSQSKGLYTLSETIFKKYKDNPLVKRNFYQVQSTLKTIEDQIKDMDEFIEKMSKEIEEFTEKTSQDIDDLEKNFIKKKNK
ncbi:MAG TPA: FecR domain-containing protein [Spirochaetota bacterium]|nr:FecR domain-containing protein [Spirochaetota bacterium]HOM38079.1 FecR domain-containing protein [Spirochaetota bacterium]HPQ48882.1 FecR domain-containing protein [Spirochaetota bacterium]